jgi:hypothetical protein
MVEGKTGRHNELEPLPRTHLDASRVPNQPGGVQRDDELWTGRRGSLLEELDGAAADLDQVEQLATREFYTSITHARTRRP